MTPVIIVRSDSGWPPERVAQIAQMHADALPASLLTELGLAVLRRYYEFVAGSPLESLWVAYDNIHTPVGACVLSDEPRSVLTRFARDAPFTLGRGLLTQLVWNRTLRARLRHRLHERGGGNGSHAPEVTQIFTEQSMRGRGYGHGLLWACENTLRERGVRSYFVHTERDDNDAGIRFYRREGFHVIGESRSFGQTFLVMQKDLD